MPVSAILISPMFSLKNHNQAEQKEDTDKAHNSEASIHPTDKGEKKNIKSQKKMKSWQSYDSKS